MKDDTAADDPYATLGVERTASAKEIRAAWRRLVKASHPDLHPGDPQAEARFKRVSAAWDLLGDPERRARFDRGEIDASGAEAPQPQWWRQHAEQEGAERYHAGGGFDDFADMSDVFSELFRRRGEAGPRRGRDLRLRLELDFLDAVRGARPRVELPGAGRLEIPVPAGVREGEVLRLAGLGEPGPGGGPAGDALVEVAVRPHPVFLREGDDIRLELPITLYEAVLGGKVEVPTVRGRVTMTVPKGASGGKVLRLRGKGVKAAGRPAGDQLVTLRIVAPEAADEELVRFMEGWRERRPYDPRAKLRSL